MNVQTVVQTDIKVSSVTSFDRVLDHAMFVFTDRPSTMHNGVFVKLGEGNAIALNSYRNTMRPEPSTQVRVVQFVENQYTPLTYGRRLEL